MMLNVFAGFALGLGLGGSCAAVCAPILAPHIAAEYRTLKKGLLGSVYFSLGRLFTYLILGVIMTYIGIVIWNTRTAGPIIVILGIILMIYGFAISFGVRTDLGPKICCHFVSGKSTVMLGMLTGFRPCFPLIAALTYILTLPNIFEGITFMSSFWLGSSVYFPLIGMSAGIFSNIAIKQASITRIRRISGIALFITGLYLFILGTGFLSNPAFVPQPLQT
ncbi:MAG: sulfite exporter TauE/SafE family protein [Candidatus Bathyarchaeota archaeon]|nr:sulfite exporter TauE/SafE family protein [Candidatus Bathyarchaeota archaeon]